MKEQSISNLATLSKTQKNKVLIRRFAPYYKKYRGVFALDLLFAALTTMCDMVLPLLVRTLTRTAQHYPENFVWSLILKVGFVYVFLKLIEVGSYSFMNSTGHIMGAKIERDMREDLFVKLQKLSDNFYNANQVGQLMSRITADLFDVTEFAHHCPEEYFIGLIKLIVSAVILSFIDPWLTLAVFIFVPLMYFASKASRARLRKNRKFERVRIGELNAALEDSLQGSRVVRSFANEALERKRFQEKNERFVDAKKKGYYSMAEYNAINRFFAGMMYVVVIFFGAYRLMTGHIDGGDFFSYFLYIAVLSATVMRLVEFTDQFERGMSGIERFIEVMDTDSDIQEKPNAQTLQNVQGLISFEDVSFRYVGTKDWVLRHLNLEIKAGENVALVGSSGAGKTTLSNLVPRFYDVTEGSLRIDGQDVRDLKLQSLRRNIGIVQQDVYLFAGSIKDNIRYGKPEATDEEVYQAAKLAAAYDFIVQLPQGFDSEVGERGVRLSGGQKQRISIARVFLKNPPILILDEATSALDNESEALVRDSLQRLSKNRTTLTIAHRLSTVRYANRILVLTENGIEEEGTHEELLKKGGLYTNLYQSGTELV